MKNSEINICDPFVFVQGDTYYMYRTLTDGMCGTYALIEKQISQVALQQATPRANKY